MKRIMLAAAALALSAGIAHADPFSAMYGNTLSVTAASGAKIVVFINQDMSWEQHNGDGSVSKGTYAWKDDTTACFTMTDPAPKDAKMATTCFPQQADHKVGETWSVTNAEGKTSTLTLTAGR